MNKPEGRWVHAVMMGDELVTFGEGEMIPGIPPVPEIPAVYETFMLTRLGRNCGGRRLFRDRLFFVERLRLVAKHGTYPERTDDLGGWIERTGWHWGLPDGPLGWVGDGFHRVSEHRSFNRAVAVLRESLTWH